MVQFAPEKVVQFWFDFAHFAETQSGQGFWAKKNWKNWSKNQFFQLCWRTWSAIKAFSWWCEIINSDVWWLVIYKSNTCLISQINLDIYLDYTWIFKSKDAINL